MSVSHIDVSLESDINVVAGMSRSGKSAYAKIMARERLKSKSTLLVWDPDGEYVDAGITRAILTRRDWLKMILSDKPARASFVAPVTRDNFNFWALSVAARRDCVAVAEETADVTNAGKAPVNWGQLIRKCAKRNISLIAVTQTPTESDKTVMRNARRIICFMVDREPDIAYMAREMRVSPATIAGLARLEAIIVDKHGSPRESRFRHTFKAA